MKEQAIEKEVFIPIMPSKSERLGMLLAQAIPGLTLAMAVFASDPVTIGALLTSGFCFVSGLLVVFLAVREFRVPGTVSKFRIDMIAVFAGFLVVAQGTQLFNALKGFQPAHLCFLAGSFFIFRGVLFPQAKFKKGFRITEEIVSYTSSSIRSTQELSRKGLGAIDFSAGKINFRYSGGETKILNLRGAENPNELLVSLKRVLLPAKEF